MKMKKKALRCRNIYTSLSPALTDGYVICGDDEIIFVGSEADGKELIDSETEIFDFEDNFLMPGFNDFHEMCIRDRIMDNLINLFLMEVKGSVFLGCEILAICIVTGLLSNFSNTFGSKTVSSLGTMICGVVITALCISNFYQTYQYCQDRCV